MLVCASTAACSTGSEPTSSGGDAVAPTVSSPQPGQNRSAGSGTSTTTPVTSGPSTSRSSTALRSAVTAYSDAYLGGDAKTAFAIRSTRCQIEIGRGTFTNLVSQAALIYGKLPIRSYSEQVDGSTAKVTYGYDVSTLNQTEQPWTRHQGEWRYDNC